MSEAASRSRCSGQNPPNTHTSGSESWNFIYLFKTFYPHSFSYRRSFLLCLCRVFNVLQNGLKADVPAAGAPQRPAGLRTHQRRSDPGPGRHGPQPAAAGLRGEDGEPARVTRQDERVRRRLQAGLPHANQRTRKGQAVRGRGLRGRGRLRHAADPEGAPVAQHGGGRGAAGGGGPHVGVSLLP